MGRKEASHPVPMPSCLGLLCSRVVWLLLCLYVSKHTHSKQCNLKGIASCSEEVASLWRQNVCLFIRFLILPESCNQLISAASNQIKAGQLDMSWAF